MSEIVLYNNDLIREILGYLNVEEIKEIRFVSKTFHKSSKKYEEKIKLICNLCNEFNRQLYYNYKMMKKAEHKRCFSKSFNEIVEKLGYYCCKECLPRCGLCMNINTPDKMTRFKVEGGMYWCKKKCKKRCKSCRQPVSESIGTTFVSKNLELDNIQNLSLDTQEMIETEMIRDLFVEEFDIYCYSCYSY
jgi:hypothetical protein